ncbi:TRANSCRIPTION FACTOR putative-RELATED [Salix purpurea]|uniref:TRANSCRIPTION FACTOR putative-RELATED n=1 Tax=Salix purpurea TaxID=77065 RepID=A0A9Q0Z901_SALPP|nr:TRANSCRIPTION FACTOR putative-RELATED [Salix purpurea]
MGRRPCCDKVGLKRGTWSVEEDQKLTNFILCNGIKCWRHVPKLAGRTDNEIKNHWNTRIKKKLKLLGLDPHGGEPPVEQDHNTRTKASREDSDAGWSTFPSLTDLQFDSCLSRSSMEKYVLQEGCSGSYWIDDYVDSLLSWDGINFNNLE